VTKERRKAIPAHVKIAVALRALGYQVDQVEWDHQPPLSLREWDEAKQDTIPPANDPDHIQIMLISDHRHKTNGNKATSADGDIAKIAKAKRIAKDPSGGTVFAAQPKGIARRFIEEIAERPKRKIPSRPFPKQGRKLNVARQKTTSA
jgi:hypothetical protein